MKMHLGTAPDSWGIWFPDDPQQLPWQQFLDEVVEAGYDAIELGPFGYLPTKPERLADELAQRNIRLTGGFVNGRLEASDYWSRTEANLRDLCELVQALGGTYIGILNDQYSDPHTGEQISDAELPEAGWTALVDSCHRVGDCSREYGLTALLHPHADTTIEYEPQIETFLSRTDPEVVGIQLDVGHHAYRGGDPVEFMRKHHERVGVVHLKSVDPLISAKVNEEGIPWPEAVALGIFIEPMKGTVDFRALRRALEEVSYSGWAIVEQDMYPAPPEKPLPIARDTYLYLRQLGY